jgi:hypothetical protein
MNTSSMQDQQQRALVSFERDFPSLWIEHAGQRVAYHGDRQLGFGQKHELYQECFKRGLQREEFVIFCIEPQETEITLGPVVLD